MAKKGLKYRIPQFVVLRRISVNFISFKPFSESTKGLSALFSSSVACYEPLCFALRLNAPFHAPQATRSIHALKRCHCFILLRNHNQSKATFATKSYLQYQRYFDIIFVAHKTSLLIERRFLRKMTDKKQQKQNSLSSTKIEQLSKQPII